MFPPAFDYVRATSVEDAIDQISQSNGKFLAGGHSLLPVMKLRLADPGTLVDIGGLDGMRGISATDGGFSVGALTTHTMLEAADDAGFPAALSEAAGMIADPQVRNRGTVGGNVAHADPASDLPTVLAALGATFNMTGADGSRSVGASDFFTGLFETALGDNDILTSVDVASEAAGTGSAYAKLFNPASRYAMVGACATITLGADGSCSACTVAVGGLTSMATVLSAVGDAMVGGAVSDDGIAAAAAMATDAVGDDVMGDMHASADYRLRMLPIFVSRALTEAASRAG